jgi:hypothetical protein
MSKVAILITIFTLLYCEIQFKPILSLSYLSTGSDFQPSNKEINIIGAGLGAIYESGNLYIAAEFINHRVYGVKNRSQLHTFNRSQGLSWGQSPGGAENSFDYDLANLNIRYTLNDGELIFGKMNPQWGEGEAKLTFSDKSPSFPLFGFNWRVNSNILIEYFHGQLKSGIVYTDGGGISKNKNVSRSVAAHRIVWNITDKLQINAMESVIYAVRGIDIHYMMPFVPFWSLQHYLGDTDNLQMAGELIYSPTKRLSLYSTIFMDEWAPEKTFDDDNHNWFGYQSGIKYIGLISKRDKLIFEYTWTDHRIYHHKYIENDYYSHNYPLGFWAGPHAEEIYFSYYLKLYDMEWMMKISNAKRGKFISIENQYNDNIDNEQRYDGPVEEKLFINLEVTRYLYKALFMTAGITYVDWKNAGFDPSGGAIQDLQNVQKTSFNLSFNYNY